MSQTSEQVMAELWPPEPHATTNHNKARAKRCKAGTRKRVCKKDGQEVIDCFDPCSSSSPTGGNDDGKKRLKQTIRSLNVTVKKLQDDRQKCLHMLKERDNYIEAFKKREHKTMKSMKKANTTIKELVTEPLKCRADLKKYREKLSAAEMNIHNVMSMNNGLQIQNENLLNKCKELNTRCDREKNEKTKCARQLSALKNDLAECHKQLKQCLEQQANPDSFGESSSDESEDSHTAAAAASSHTAAAAAASSHTAAAAAASRASHTTAAAATSRKSASQKSAGNKLRAKYSK
jgi:chromosome segregation ATPase